MGRSSMIQYETMAFGWIDGDIQCFGKGYMQNSHKSSLIFTAWQLESDDPTEIWSNPQSFHRKLGSRFQLSLLQQ